jgi:hypothetical protein
VVRCGDRLVDVPPFCVQLHGPAQVGARGFPQGRGGAEGGEDAPDGGGGVPRGGAWTPVASANAVSLCRRWKSSAPRRCCGQGLRGGVILRG